MERLFAYDDVVCVSKKKDAVFCFGLSEFLAGENQMQAMQLALVPARRKVNDGVGGAA
jgi:hypothetical protein